jgi:uncharacterized repeat protein (TIGR01451 family)
MSLRILLACALALLVVPSTAAASTTIGQVFTPTAQTSATIAQTGVASGAGYTVPSDGVITSWQFEADAAGAQVKLKVLRANSDGSYTVVGSSDVATVGPTPDGSTPTTAATFQTRIPVKAGDYIGTAAISSDPNSSPGKTVAFTGDQNDTILLVAGDQDAGSTATYSNVNSIRVDATATIEPDADHDGYGDETQDKCPTDPNVQGVCSANLKLSVRTDEKIVHPGDQVTFTIDAHNDGPSIARVVQLSASLSPELRLLGTAGGTCTGAESLMCQMGDVGPNSDATLTVIARALTTGLGSVAARTFTNTTEPNTRDNSAPGSVSIQWFPGVCANVKAAGGPGRNVLKGTGAGDLIDGLAGNDIIAGLSGSDCLNGGDGNDRITGGDGNDRISGGSGNDILAGNSGNDTIDGGPGNDRIDGGSGADHLNGGPGNDSINAIDGKRDTVDCGPGRGDTARVDAVDRVKNCERVLVAKPKKKR